jgi:hypothetical protein
MFVFRFTFFPASHLNFDMKQETGKVYRGIIMRNKRFYNNNLNEALEGQKIFISKITEHFFVFDILVSLSCGEKRKKEKKKRHWLWLILFSWH